MITPLLPHGLSDEGIVSSQRTLLDGYLREQQMDNFVSWYYTAMAMRFSGHLSPQVVIYDCMDELSAFQGAPPELIDQEHRLFAKADVVFAGGASLYAAKRTQHKNVHLFPSSIDHAHFSRARASESAGPTQASVEPPDQRDIPHPRIGFYGVIDERMDLELLEGIAEARPEWHLVILGPVVKINPEMRSVVVLRHVMHLSYEDMAETLAVPEKTVKSRLYSARQLLRTILVQEGAI